MDVILTFLARVGIVLIIGAVVIAVSFALQIAGARSNRRGGE